MELLRIGYTSIVVSLTCIHAFQWFLWLFFNDFTCGIILIREEILIDYAFYQFSQVNSQILLKSYSYWLKAEKPFHIQFIKSQLKSSSWARVFRKENCSLFECAEDTWVPEFPKNPKRMRIKTFRRACFLRYFLCTSRESNIVF